MISKKQIISIAFALTISFTILFLLSFLASLFVNKILMPANLVRFTMYDGFASITLFTYSVLLSCYILLAKPIKKKVIISSFMVLLIIVFAVFLWDDYFNFQSNLNDLLSNLTDFGNWLSVYLWIVLDIIIVGMVSFWVRRKYLIN